MVTRKQLRTAKRNGSFTGMAYTLAAIFMLVVIAAIGIQVGKSYYKRDTFTTKVINKERVCDRSDCTYLVFTERGTYAIKDAFFGAGRFNSSDIYGRIKEDRCYTIKAYGWRLPFWSKYENIDTITEASCG